MTTNYIVIPLYNSSKYLTGLFESLTDQTMQDFKLILVDNNKDMSDAEFVSKNITQELQRRIKVITNKENRGYAEANNQGIEEAFRDKDCQNIICFNSDITLESDLLEKLVQCSSKYPEAGSIQAKLIWADDPRYMNAAGEQFSLNGISFNRGAYEAVSKYDQEEEIFGVCPAAALYKREALEEVKQQTGYFDRTFFTYGESTDLAFRLRWRGWKSVYCPTAIAYHHVGGSGGRRNSFTVYYTNRNYTWLLYKNLNWHFWIYFWWLIFSTEVMQLVLNLLRGYPVVIKAKFDAYKGLLSVLKNKSPKSVPYRNLAKWFILKWKVKFPKEARLT